jgi:hypothetical protein
VSQVKKAFGGAALLTALMAAPNVQAQRLTAEPVLGASLTAPPLQLDQAPAIVGREILQPSAGPGLGVSARRYEQADGSVAVGRALVANWPLAGALEAGVGLFSVGGGGRRHNEFRRDWAVKQVAPRNENIAAVGMRLRF